MFGIANSFLSDFWCGDDFWKSSMFYLFIFTASDVAIYIILRWFSWWDYFYDLWAMFHLLSTKELVRGDPFADEVYLGTPGYTWVYQKVIYNIGTEILTFTRIFTTDMFINANLTIFGRTATQFPPLSNQLGPKA